MSEKLTAQTIQQLIRDALLAYRARHDLEDLLARLAQLAGPALTHVNVELYRASGKYYTEESWRIPGGAIGPYDMRNSPDFHRIDPAGVVVVPAQEPWGFPAVIMPTP
ncbi:MAG: hypothetical protein ACJ72N_27520 [Labedaea sp.]